MSCRKTASASRCIFAARSQTARAHRSGEFSIKQPAAAKFECLLQVYDICTGCMSAGRKYMYAARESCAVSLGPVLIRNSCEPIGAKCLGGNSAEPEPERDTARTIPFAFSYHGLSLALLWLLGMKAAAHPHHTKSKPKTFLLYNPFMSHRNQPEKLPCVYFGRGLEI